MYQATQSAFILTSRGAGFLTTRRIKSFKCFVIGAVIINLLLFLSLAWKNAPRSPLSDVMNAGLLDVASNNNPNEIQPKRPFELGLPKGGASLEATSGWTIQEQEAVRKSACSYRTAVYMNNKHIDLNLPPFVHHVKSMTCLEGGEIAIFDDKFVKFNNVIIDSSKITNLRKGGEKMEDVWNQSEDEEYLKLEPGFFKASCLNPPVFNFPPADHLLEWAKSLQCYTANETVLSQYPLFTGTTLAIQRYEYVNLYHTMTDFYNAFVLMLIFGVPPSKLNILAVDAHPEGALDPVWKTLFGKFFRAGHLKEPTVFENLVWGLLGYFSPLNEHERTEVPYLTEFREFFLTRHNISTDHAINCDRLNVVIIWRRDYVAHPRNPKGSVVRKFDNEEEIVQQVKETLGPGANVQGMQLDNMLMQDQLHVIAKTDILMGMHGAGLSHILFLPATSGVIEFKPEYSNPALQHFKAFAYWRKLPYTIWHNYDTNNEKEFHKTYIPRDIVKKTVTEIFQEICKTVR
ncbi:unnamed protein product [Candidula unifasciata]|uniref:EGF domain-specific O-linked N-acetylglucosamine transferase n=1 Tax=Candidula unifasciata TaxID=100452 RepID=A0A8S3ZJ03_9EUPU|nr:unnamed protein product [Candidula unifasciata]